MKKLKYIIDIDETICTTPDSRDYNLSKPIPHRIKKINELYRSGHNIKYYTARGYVTGIDWYKTTYDQLQNWGCKFHSLECKKPDYDVWIDDKALNASILDADLKGDSLWPM